VDIKRGQRLQLKYSTQTPKATGTVVDYTGSTFTVRYDGTRENGRRIPGGKHTYPDYALRNFQEPGTHGD